MSSQKTTKLKRIFTLITVLVLVSTLIQFLYVSRRVEAEAAINAKWVNRAVIQIDKYQFSDDSLGDKALNINKAGGNVNTIVNKMSTGKFTTDNVLNGPIYIGSKEFFHAQLGGCNSKERPGLDLYNTGNSDDDITVKENKIQVRDIWANNVGDGSSSTVSIGCFIVNENHPGVIEPGDADRRFIWFTMDKDAKTLTRVDNKGGAFTKGGDIDGKPTFYTKEQTVGNRKCDNDVGPHVTIDSGDINNPGIYDATYETCANHILKIKVEKPADGNNNGDNAAGVATPTCESQNKSVILAWLVCGSVNLIDTTMKGLTSIVDSQLDFKDTDINTTEFRTMWSYFKNIASFLLVGVVLVIIIGQAISKE